MDSLVYNGSMPTEEAKRKIKDMDAINLYRMRPKWLKDCVEISISAQNLKTGDVVYRRRIKFGGNKSC